jgi:chromosome partitioning protein
MKVIGILNQKGGVGKTTLATCLSVAFEHDKKKVLLIDLDPQATACFWHDTRKLEYPAVISIQSVRLDAIIQGAKDTGADIVIIDGAAIQRAISYDVARVCDYIMIPTKAAVFDATSMQDTIKVLKQHNVIFSVLLNMTSPNGKELNDFKALINKLGVTLCTSSLGNRKDFFRAQNAGLSAQEYNSQGKAAQEINNVYKYICKHLYS